MMRRMVLVLLTLPAQTFAHSITAESLAIGPTWSYDPWLTIPLYCLGIGFFWGTRNVWRAAGLGRGVPIRHVASFWAGWSILALAIVSPLHWLGEHLFTAHMIEHELLMVVAAPLIAFSRPSGALSWSLPSCWRPYAGALTGATPVIAVWMRMSNPWVATALQGALLWLWHTPLLYERALASETVHRVQHLSFFLAAILFWWSLFYSRTYPRRTREIIAVACLFLTVLHSGLLGALLTLSARIWFITQGQLSGEFNLTPLEDQQLAGVVMWIPMGIVYTAAALHFARRWLLPTGRREAEISLA